MNYEARFIEGMTVEEINAELQKMYDDQYSKGMPIDRPRMWNLEHTKKVLCERYIKTGEWNK